MRQPPEGGCRLSSEPSPCAARRFPEWWKAHMTSFGGKFDNFNGVGQPQVVRWKTGSEVSQATLATRSAKHKWVAKRRKVDWKLRGASHGPHAADNGLHSYQFHTRGTRLLNSFGAIFFCRIIYLCSTSEETCTPSVQVYHPVEVGTVFSCGKDINQRHPRVTVVTFFPGVACCL